MHNLNYPGNQPANLEVSRMRSGKRLLIAVTSTILALMLASHGERAEAVIVPCSIFGNARFSPENPGPQDVIRYRVLLSAGVNGFPPDISTARTRLTVSSTTALHIDVVLTDDAAAFPDHQPVSIQYSIDSDFGALGPLPAGTYSVVTEVRAPTPTGELASLCLPKENTFTVHPQAAPVVTASVVEFYNPVLDHYFMTQDVDEIRDLDSGFHQGWMRTGASFRAYVAQKSDKRGNTVCRWYGLPTAGLDTHVFTASIVECDAIATAPMTAGKWQKETFDAFEIALPDTLTGVCRADTVPVFRLWNGRADSNHRYTTSPATKQAMMAKGYVPEGFGPDAVGMCALI